MTDASPAERALAYLRRDPLRQIVPLKMLTAYPGAARVAFRERGGAAGALLLLPAQTFLFDRSAYPWAALVVLLAADRADVAGELLEQVPRDTPLVFKLGGALEQAAARERFALARLTAFLSYTAPPSSPAPPDPAVRVSQAPDSAWLELLAAQGHDRAELADLFARGLAFALALGDPAAPAAVCMAYRNFGQIYEVGGLYTRPAARRQGLARRLVSTALHELARRGLTPRYQVHEDNRASVGLAEALGLRRFVTVTHWRYDPSPDRMCYV